jgi:hypothetical protein
LFNELFIWTPGEYTIELDVLTAPPLRSGSYKSKYRFTLFESDTADLRKFVNDFKYGGGISWTPNQHEPISVPISEA